MEYYVGLDVSLKRTSICVVNQMGSIVQECVVDSDPEAIASFVHRCAPCQGGAQDANQQE
jgi:transposase